MGLKNMNVVDFTKNVLKKPELLETTIRGKLGQKFVGSTSNLRNITFKFNKLNGTVEAGLEMDLEFTYDGITYTYKGRDQFKATKAGKPAGDGSEADKDLKGDSIEMVASDLIAAYAKAIGAKPKEISDLIDNTMGEFDNGNIVFEAIRPSQQADDEETAELAKLVKEQNAKLKAIAQGLASLASQAQSYDKWLNQNKVQALMTPEAERLAKAIKANLDEIEKII